MCQARKSLATNKSSGIDGLQADILETIWSEKSDPEAPTAHSRCSPPRVTVRILQLQINMVFTLRQLLEKAIEQDMPLYTVFTDFTKVFDTVNRECIWSLLRR